MAENQDASYAQLQIGYFFLWGLGVPVNYSESIRWYRKAAKLGDPTALHKLGFFYASGKFGVDKNLVKAYAFFYITDELVEPDVVESKQRLTSEMTAEQIEQGKMMAAEFAQEYGLKQPE